MIHQELERAHRISSAKWIAEQSANKYTRQGYGTKKQLEFSSSLYVSVMDDAGNNSSRKNTIGKYHLKRKRD